MIRLPRGVQKGCGGGGGGDGGAVNTGAGASADTKLFTGFPCVSTIRTLPWPNGTSYQVWHTPMSHWMPRNGNPCPGHQLCGCGEKVSAWAGPVDSPNRTAAPPDTSAPAMALVKRWCGMASRPFPDGWGLTRTTTQGPVRYRSQQPRPRRGESGCQAMQVTPEGSPAGDHGVPEHMKGNPHGGFCVASGGGGSVPSHTLLSTFPCPQRTPHHVWHTDLSQLTPSPCDPPGQP